MDVENDDSASEQNKIYRKNLLDHCPQNTSRDSKNRARIVNQQDNLNPCCHSN